MGVGVDKARRGGQAVRPDLFPRLEAGAIAHRQDPAAFDGDIPQEPGPPRAVDHRRSANDQVHFIGSRHVHPLLLPPRKALSCQSIIAYKQKFENRGA